MRVLALLASGVAVAVLGFPEPAAAHQQKTTRAARPSPTLLTESQTSAHFVVHYSTSGLEDATTPEKAARALELAEQAWTTQIDQWGYPRPVDDGDGRVDIYIHNLDAGVWGYVASEKVVGHGATGYIGLDPNQPKDEGTISHELFHLVQLAMWKQPSTVVMEATADWVQERMGYRQSTDWRYLLHTSLTCSAGEQPGCLHGHERWVFFEFLVDRYGPGIIRDLFERARANNVSSALGMLRGTLAAFGTSVEREYAAFAYASLYAEGHRSPHLKGFSPVQQLGWNTSAPIRETVALPRLAMRLVPIAPAGGDATCAGTTLRLSVKLPNADAAAFVTPARPGELPTPLPVVDGVATAAVPWSACATAPSLSLLLVNAHATADDQQFVVEGDVVPALTPTPAAIATETPAARETIRVGAVVARAGRSGTAVVTVTAPGVVQLSCGRAGVSATYTVRAGRNRLRFDVPAHVRAGRHGCVATSSSASGSQLAAARFTLVVR